MLPVPLTPGELSATKTFHLFRRDTGLFSGRSITCMSSSAEAMAGPEHIAIAEVDHPHALRLVDGRLIEHRGPQPDADYEWNATLGRWWMKLEVQQRINQKRDAQEKIDALEKQQARAIREERLGRGGTPAELRKRLEDIDDAIIALRATINP